ncbi:hypothetical protein H6P81_017888 [Aristolochia fimbriata]|uniref:Uncharacterized protein n=1 Tax=Aristolochia fimbriata TaxID=158543 RepID=A0AAV7E0S8_ARIFI|nr:hypothetical protein H6P81_017888 [Aristolochia fimbriata]
MSHQKLNLDYDNFKLKGVNRKTRGLPIYSDTPDGNGNQCLFFCRICPKLDQCLILLKICNLEPVDEDNDDANENVNSDSFSTHKLRKAPKPDNKLHFSSGGSSNKSQTEEPTSGHDTVFHFESSKEIQVQHDSGATATLEIEIEFDRDAREIRERTQKQAEESLNGNMKTGGKLNKGIYGYIDYKAGFRREQIVSGEKAGGAHGPLRASAHIRASARFVY